MAKASIVRDVTPRDADAPGFHDVHADIDVLRRRLRGEPSLDEVMRRTGDDAGDAIRSHVPGAYLDPRDGELDVNAGYDPDSPDGELEALIWHLVKGEVAARLGARDRGRRTA